MRSVKLQVILSTELSNWNIVKWCLHINNNVDNIEPELEILRMNDNQFANEIKNAN